MASYTEQQLSEVTGLGGEAVRRYFEVGLVAPRADGIYDDAVRARLVAIDRLKTVRGVRSIELIREALDAMSAAQIQEFIAATGDKAPSSDGKGRDDDAPRTAVLTRVRPSGPAPEVAPDKAPTASFGAVKARDDLPFAHTDALPVASVMLPSLVPQWSRIELVQGVELHIRADIGGEAQRLVDELRQRFTR